MNKTIQDTLAKCVADTQILWNKVHNLHWNIQGPSFQRIHAFTEDIYDQLAEQYDALAERILMVGGKPPVTVADCLALSSVVETKATTFTFTEVLDHLEHDLGQLLTQYMYIQAKAAESGDPGTDSLMTGMIEDLEKTLWMIRSSR